MLQNLINVWKSKINAHADKIITVVFLTLCYVTTHHKILYLGEAVYWDDWVILGSDLKTLLACFEPVGVIFNWFAYLHLFIQWIGFNYALLTFVFYFLAGAVLYQINREQLRLSNGCCMAITFLFYLLPFNFARVAATNFTYIFCLTVFFIGWYFIRRSRFLSIILFLVSFGANQFLVFFAIPVLVNFQHLFQRAVLSVKESANLAVFLGIPFLYFSFENLFFPSSLYNIFDSGAAYNNAANSYFVMAVFFREIINLKYGELQFILILILSLLLIIPFFNSVVNFSRIIQNCILNGLPGRGFHTVFHEVKNRFESICFVCLFVISAVLPYFLTDKYLGFDDWTSRHQILFSVALSYCALTFSSASFKNIILLCSIAFVLFVPKWWSVYDSYLEDWEKTTLIIDAVAENHRLSDCDVLIFTDLTGLPNALGRTYRFYEFNGMLARVYPVQDKFALNAFDAASYFDGRFDPYFTVDFKASNHVRSNDSLVCDINLIKGGDSETINAQVSKSSYLLDYTTRL